jgi:hypothetical protein
MAGPRPTTEARRVRPRPRAQVPGAAGASLRAWFSSADAKQLLNELEAVGLACMRAPAAAAAARGAPPRAAAGEPAVGAGGGALPLEGRNIVVTGGRRAEEGCSGGGARPSRLPPIWARRPWAWRRQPPHLPADAATVPSAPLRAAAGSFSLRGSRKELEERLQQVREG